MDYLAEITKIFVTWDTFVVTLDSHPKGAAFFVLLIFAICYAVVAKRKQ
jgi:hypothetical protein